MKVEIIEDVTKTIYLTEEETFAVEVRDYDALILNPSYLSEIPAGNLVGTIPAGVMDPDDVLAQLNQAAGDVNLDRIPDTLTGKDADTLDGQHGSYYRDADTLDGQHGSYYRDAGNLNAGTVDPERMGYDSGFDYVIGEFTTKNGYPYRCIQANGPGTANATAPDHATLGPLFWELTGGGGQGQINFLKNSLKSSNITNWSRSTGSLSWSTATPISGGGALLASALLSGQTIDGFLNDVDPDQIGKAWQLDLSYHIDNAATYVDGELTACLLDGSTELQGGNIPVVKGQVNTTSVWVYPTTTLTGLKVRIKAGGSGRTGDIRIANVSIRPQQILSMPSVGEVASYTPVVAGCASISMTLPVRCYRVGNMLHVNGRFTVTTPNASFMYINLPSGLTFDGSGTRYQVGRWFRTNAGGANTLRGGTLAIVNGTSSMYLQNEEYAPATAMDAPIAGNTLFANGDQCEFWAIVPIAQWSSSIQVSGEDVEYSSNFHATTNTLSDTTSFAYGIDGSPFYGFTGQTTYTRRIEFKSDIKQSDSIDIEVYNSTGGFWSAHTITRIGSLEYKNHNGVEYGIRYTGVDKRHIDVVFQQWSTPASAAFGTAGQTWAGILSEVSRWRVVKRSGGSLAQVPPVVRAEYTTIAAGSNPLQFNTKVEDTHNAVTTGASWKFTAQFTGIADIEATLRNTGGAFDADVYVDGVSTNYKVVCVPGANQWMTGRLSIRLNKGQYIDLRANSNVGTMLTANAIARIAITMRDK